MENSKNHHSHAVRIGYPISSEMGRWGMKAAT